MRLRFNIGQLLLLTALAALVVALLTSVYGRAQSMFQPNAVSYSPDGQTMAAQFSDGTVTVWNRQGRQLGQFDTREGWIHFSMRSDLQLLDEDHVIVKEDNGQFSIWEIETGEKLATVGSTTLSPLGDSSAISGDGKTSATIQTGAQTDVDIFSTETGQRIKRMPPEIGGPRGIALSHDGSRLAVVRFRGEIEVWDIATEQRIAGPYAIDADPQQSSLVFSSDLRVAAAADPNRIDIDQGQPMELLGLDNGQRAIIHTPDAAFGLKLSPDGTLLAATGDRDELTLIDTSNGQQRGKITPAYQQPVFDLSQIMPTPKPVAFSPDGQEVLIGSNSEVAVYDVATGQLSKRLWGMPQSLGKWFFGPAFIVWAMFWGVARRRQRISEARGADDVVDAEVVEVATNEDVVEPIVVRPPHSLIAAWILLFIGGILAIGWAMFIIFNQFSCLALLPMPYFSLFCGLTTIAAAAGRRTDKLPLIYSVQMGNIICFDWINFTLGIAGMVLAHRPAAKEYANTWHRRPA